MSALRYSPRNVYVASSWRNTRHPSVVVALRDAGHRVYDYRNPEHRGWSESNRWWEQPGCRAVSFPTVVGDVPQRQLAFRTDMEALRAADTVVLVLDSGKSAHLEAGFAAGAGKLLFVLGDVEQHPELMYGMATACMVHTAEVLDLLARWDPVARTFDPAPGAVVHYRHRVTGEVRELVPRRWAINPTIELLDAEGRLARFWPGHGIEEWERIEGEGSR